MTDYDKRNKLASRAAGVLGAQEAQTLMDMISTGERLELQLTRYRAELDQKFASIDQKFAQIDQRFAQIDQRFAQIDQRFADMDQKFVNLDRRIFDSEERTRGYVAAEMTSMRRFLVTALTTTAGVVLASLFAVAVPILVRLY